MITDAEIRARQHSDDIVESLFVKANRYQLEQYFLWIQIQLEKLQEVQTIKQRIPN